MGKDILNKTGRVVAGIVNGVASSAGYGFGIATGAGLVLATISLGYTMGVVTTTAKYAKKPDEEKEKE